MLPRPAYTFIDKSASYHQSSGPQIQGFLSTKFWMSWFDAGEHAKTISGWEWVCHRAVHWQGCDSDIRVRSTFHSTRLKEHVGNGVGSTSDLAGTALVMDVLGLAQALP